MIKFNNYKNVEFKQLNFLYFLLYIRYKAIFLKIQKNIKNFYSNRNGLLN